MERGVLKALENIQLLVWVGVRRVHVQRIIIIYQMVAYSVFILIFRQEGEINQNYNFISKKGGRITQWKHYVNMWILNVISCY